MPDNTYPHGVRTGLECRRAVGIVPVTSRFTYDGDIIEGPALRTLRTDQDRFNP